MKKNAAPAGRQGFVAMSTVLIISVVVLAISVTVSFLSIGQAQSSLALMKGEENLGLVEGCVEDALLKVRSDSNYSGGNVSRPEGNCQISLVSKNGNNWTLDISPISSQFYRKIRVFLDRTPPKITLISWREI